MKVLWMDYASIYSINCLLNITTDRNRLHSQEYSLDPFDDFCLFNPFPFTLFIDIYLKNTLNFRI